MSAISGRPPVLIKICGLTRREDASLCASLGADFMGFIFAAASSRRVTPTFAASVPAQKKISKVGVFANQPLEEVLRVMDEAKLDYAQLHGGEDEEFCRAVGPERVIKVLWPERLAPVNSSPLRALEKECGRFAPVCAYFLLDAGTGGGGSGKETPRRELGSFSPPRPWLLAGGLGPGNVAAALAECSPQGVDCNSGVEVSPGLKDEEKLRTLFKRLRG